MEQRVLAAALLLLQFGAIVIEASGPPDIMSGGASRATQPLVVTAALSKAAKLPCAVQPVTFLEWSYAGQLLTSGTTVMSTSELYADLISSRLDGANSYLRISSVQRGHAGIYTCRVVTGFGTASVSVRLVVTDALGSPFPDPDMSTPTPGNSIIYSIVAPYLSNKTVSAGEQVTLECHVRGLVSIPGVVWYKQQIGDDTAEDDRLVDTSIGLPQAFSSEYGLSGTWWHVRSNFYSNTDVRSSGQFIGKLTIRAVSTQHAGHYLCSVSSSEQPLYRTAFLSVRHESSGGADDRPASAADGEPSDAQTTPSSTSWLTTVFGSYSATLAVVIAVPCVVLLLASAAVIYAVNKRKREHRAVKAKWRHQKKLGGAAAAGVLDGASRPGATQPRPTWPAGVGGSGQPTDRGSGSGGSSAPLAAQQQQQLQLVQSSVPAAASPLLLQQHPGAAAALLGPSAIPRGEGMCSWPAGGGAAAPYYSDSCAARGPAAAALHPPYQQQQHRRRPQDTDDDSSASRQSDGYTAMHGSRPEHVTQNGVYCYYGNP